MPGVPTCPLQAMFSEGPGGAPFSGVHLVFVRVPSIKKKMDFILRPKMSSKVGFASNGCHCYSITATVTPQCEIENSFFLKS